MAAGSAAERAEAGGKKAAAKRGREVCLLPVGCSAGHVSCCYQTQIAVLSE